MSPAYQRLARPWMAVVAVGLGACHERPSLHSEVGERVAEALCTIQDTCGCETERLIPSCEREVEREIGRNERRAIDAGLVLDEHCLELFMENIAALGSCAPTIEWSSAQCSVYHGDERAGESCTYYELYPLMTNCRQGLACRDGVCRDLGAPATLQEGEVCSETPGGVPSGLLGECAEGLVCDSQDTRTCVPQQVVPQVTEGDECSASYVCEPGTYCRPTNGATEVSEQSPGICTRRTEPGQPCTLPYECERFCEQGRCQVPPPVLCEVLSGWAAAREIIDQGGG
ncbi:MAG: hypothetical protein AB1Z98_25430 [Nannocystaceae bacterium]